MVKKKKSVQDKQLQQFLAVILPSSALCLVLTVALATSNLVALPNPFDGSYSLPGQNNSGTFLPDNQQNTNNSAQDTEPSPANEVIAASFEQKDDEDDGDNQAGNQTQPTLQPQEAPRSPAPDDQPLNLGRVEELVASGYIEVLQNEDATISVIDGQFTSVPVTNETTALQVMNQAATVLGARTLTGEMEIQQSGETENAADSRETYYLLHQQVNGLEVVGSEVILVVDEDNTARGLFSAYDSNVQNVNTQVASTINTEDKVRGFVIADLLADKPSNVSMNDPRITAVLDALEIECSLFIYCGDLTEKPTLAWHVKVATNYDLDNRDTEATEQQGQTQVSETILPNIACFYYLYANGNHAGEVILRNDGCSWTNEVDTATDMQGNSRTIQVQREGFIYRMVDGQRGIETHRAQDFFLIRSGTIVSVIPGPVVAKDLFGWDPRAVSVHYNMGQVEDYYRYKLGRNSWDGNGAATVTSIGIKLDHWFWQPAPTFWEFNAFWSYSNKQFRFYDGDLEKALDVCGHEFTHAVIDTTVGGTYYDSSHGLTYFGETGALNESYADILGSLIEGKTNEDKWLIGEDSIEVGRSLANPALYNQPTHYSAFKDPAWAWYIESGKDDGGVHKFSGIFNFAAYKMMTDPRTSHIPDSLWAKVFYQSLFRLSTNAKFLDARFAIISAAKNLGFTATEQQAIRDAFDAVGIVEKDSIRIVLRWGTEPKDLDSHLTGPGVGTNTRFHTFYTQRDYNVRGSNGGVVSAADLDWDCVTSYGPEVTTIRVFTPGDYYFSVHDYTNRNRSSSTALAYSGATVTVYHGTSTTPVKLSDGVTDAAFRVDTSRPGTLWKVFKLTINQNGSYTITPVNQYSYQSNPSRVG